VLPRLAKALVIVALTISLGAHWAFLQSLAWAGMLYTYSKQVGLSQGLAMTFDGDHPCGLCKTIQKGKAQERKQEQESAPVSKELKLDLPPMNFVFDHPPHPALPISVLQRETEWDCPPELPPPRPV
jgi:hypothetical protein